MSTRLDNLYIHIYTDIKNPRMFFANPDECYDTGSCLLEFIYKDLGSIVPERMKQTQMIERLADVHPYFNHINEDALRLFMKNCFDEKYEGAFCLDGLVCLQEKYKMLLSLYCSAGVTKESVKTFGLEKLYARMQYVYYEDTVVMDYFLLGFEDCLLLEFSEMIRHGIFVKICKNCGRLFIPKKSNIDYCTRVFTEDMKTCQDVGYSQTFARTVKNDELLLAYTRAYKAHYARMSKPRKRAGNLSREDFEQWYKEAKEKLAQARSGALDPQEFKEWLKK